MMFSATARCLALLAGALITLTAGAQPSKDSSQHRTKAYKNTIRYNLSGPMIFGGSYVVLGYERVLSRHQSFSINAGHATLPNVLDFSQDGATLLSSRNNTGLNLSADYRFYLARENKHDAPRGVYIGPYYYFNQYKRETSWELNEGGTVNVAQGSSRMTMQSIGAELGYQFVLGKRWTIDMVLVGPGVSYYSLKSDLEGTLTEEQRQKLQEAIAEVIKEKFPGLDYVLSNARVKSNGNLSAWSLGYRYIVHVGFRF